MNNKKKLIELKKELNIILNDLTYNPMLCSHKIIFPYEINKINSTTIVEGYCVFCKAHIKDEYFNNSYNESYYLSNVDLNKPKEIKDEIYEKINKYALLNVNILSNEELIKGIELEIKKEFENKMILKKIK